MRADIHELEAVVARVENSDAVRIHGCKNDLSVVRSSSPPKLPLNRDVRADVHELEAVVARVENSNAVRMCGREDDSAVFRQRG